MDRGTLLVLWGSPLGIAIFFAGLGVLLWGLGKMKQGEARRAEAELRERQYHDQRAQSRQAPAEGAASGEGRRA